MPIFTSLSLALDQEIADTICVAYAKQLEHRSFKSYKPQARKPKSSSCISCAHSCTPCILVMDYFNNDA